ncbi:hypothetical protein NUACC26_098160 [Scytonema sp. NUACC26]
MNVVIAVEEVEAFVHSDYAGRDLMHNLSHIHRLRKLAKEIARSYKHDPQLLELGAYFHGNISLKRGETRIPVPSPMHWGGLGWGKNKGASSELDTIVDFTNILLW